MSNKSQKETLHFSYSSIGNIVRLLVTIQFENNNTHRDVSVFHARFQNEPDEIFEEFITKLYPEGCTLGKNEIDAITKYVYSFMQKDDKSRDLYIKHDKQHYKSYIYFKPDKDLRYAETGQHSAIVQAICCDYFKSCEDINVDYLKQFIRRNFEIKSDFTTIENICNDAAYILNEIQWRNARNEKLKNIT